MKKLLNYALLAGMLLFAASCIEPVNEEENTSALQESGKVVFRASLADPQTKTTLSGDENDPLVYWLHGDKLSVFWKGVLSNDFKTLNENPSTTTEISGTLPTGGTVDDDNYYIVSYRPASASGGNYYEYNNGSPYLRTWISSGQRAAQENNVSTDVLMHAGRSSDFSVKMYNLCGLFRFKIQQRDDVRKIDFRSKNGEKLSGAIKFEFDADGVPVNILPDEQGSSYINVTLEKADGSAFEKNTWYYIAFAPNTFSKGIQITLYTPTHKATRSLGSATDLITIKRSHCLGASKLDASLEYTRQVTPHLKVNNSEVSETTLWPHGEATLSASLTGPLGVIEGVTWEWESSNSSVASVSGEGKVTGVAAGTSGPATATITAKTTFDGVDYVLSCDVTVTEAASQLGDGVFSVGNGEKVIFAKSNLYTSDNGTTFSFNTYQGQMVSFSTWNNTSRDKFKYGEIKDPFLVTFANETKTWRCLTKDQWTNLIARENSFAKATVNGVPGLILLPDGYEDVTSLNKVNEKSAAFTSNFICGSDWLQMEQNGAVFLPAAGVKITNVGTEGQYLSCTLKEENNNLVYRLHFKNTDLTTVNTNSATKGFLSVRPVRFVTTE